LRLRLLIG
jgi:hypothetical protein